MLRSHYKQNRAREILRLAAKNFSIAKIAGIYGITEQRTRQIIEKEGRRLINDPAVQYKTAKVIIQDYREMFLN